MPPKPKVALAKALKQRSMSKRQFAKLLGIDYKNVWRLFDKKSNPRFTTLVRWARLLGCRVRDLIQE